MDRKYTLEVTTHFLLNRKNYLDACTTTADRKMLLDSYNSVLKELKDLLQLEDTTDILTVEYSRITVSKKYYNSLIELFPKNKIFLLEDSVIIAI